MGGVIAQHNTIITVEEAENRIKNEIPRLREVYDKLFHQRALDEETFTVHFLGRDIPNYISKKLFKRLKDNRQMSMGYNDFIIAYAILKRSTILEK